MDETTHSNSAAHSGLHQASANLAANGSSSSARSSARAWGELIVQSNHTFLGGASHPEELVKEAARLGHAGIALTDVQTVGGAVRAHVAARASPGIRLAQGARISLDIVQGHDPSHDSSHAPPHDSPHVSSHAPPQIELALYASDRDSWGALCRLLSHRLPDGGGVERRPRARLVHDLVAMLSDHPGERACLPC